MKLIIGLGNPGIKYEKTRHNIGFILLDQFLKLTENEPNFTFNKKINILEQKILTTQNEKVILVKPQTFMNDSGIAVQKALSYYNLEIANILIIHDDLDLKTGQIKFKRNSGSAGHNGIESIMHHLKSKDFFRLRVGIDKSAYGDNRSYVLENFKDDELDIIKESFAKNINLINDFINQV